MRFDIDIKEEKEEEVNMKTEKVIGSEEGKCRDIKDDEGIRREEEEEENMDIQEEDIEIKEEVRMRIYCNVLEKNLNRLGELYVCMSVFKSSSTVFRNVSYLWFLHLYGLCNELQCWEWKCVTGNFF